MSRILRFLATAASCAVLFAGFGFADSATTVEAAEADASAKKAESKKKEAPKLLASYDDGLKLKTDDGRFSAKMNFRGQFRLNDLNSSDLPLEPDGIDSESGAQVRRARFKISGHLFKEWITYKMEYAFEGNRLIDFYGQLQPKDEFGVRLGQWKIPYNRERVDSSGAQQFVERSVVNRAFTVDRQQGLTFQGKLFKGTHAESRYWLGVFNGTGRGGELDDDSDPMYLARYQWSFMGRDLKWSQSDVKRRDKAAGSLAFATATTVGPYTRFSSSGGGQLSGFMPGVSQQYKIDQWVGEFAYQHKGLSIQAEYHEKEIDDRVNVVITELDGLYAQVGYFFHEAFDGFPEPLEIAYRFARVDPESGVMQPREREDTVAFNWFFNGHKNKVTLDISDLETTLPMGSTDEGFRARLQWDVSF